MTKQELLRHIRELSELRLQIETDLYQTVTAAREQGATWGQVGVAMGRERSNARQWHKRHRPLDRRERDA